MHENLATQLNRYDNSWYQPGGGFLVRGIWFLVNGLIFMNPVFPFSAFKVWILRLFGAKIGSGVVIKPSVNIKYPWRLEIGAYSWIGEQVWIDNLDLVKIGSHCCISQGALLLCGNHDYTKPTFDLITRSIVLEDGAWVGAKALVCPGAILRSHAVLAAGSVGVGELKAYSIYQGNPAVLKKNRHIE